MLGQSIAQRQFNNNIASLLKINEAEISYLTLQNSFQKPHVQLEIGNFSS